MYVNNPKIFPEALEWLGGRNTIHQNPFSARNAMICLTDMLERNAPEPVTLEIFGDKFIIRPQRSVARDFDLDAIKNVHIFPTHAEYAVLEICPEQGHSRLEVLKGFNEHVINSVQAFLSGVEGHLPKPSAPKYRKSPSPTPEREKNRSFVESYTENESERPSITEDEERTPEYQNDDGYEEVAQQLINTTLQESVSARESEEERALERQREIEHNQDGFVDRMSPQKEEEEDERSQATTSSVSDSADDDAREFQRQTRDSSPQNVTKTPEISSDDHEIEMNGKELVFQVHPGEEVWKKSGRKMGKPKLLVDLVDMDKICYKHTKDDGRLYVVTKKTDNIARIKPLHSDIVLYEKRHMPKKYVAQLYM
ncbi:unnamed protein product [Schistocephalus solidus]|uniref:SH2 domain-containing protein n=1 Tax=Schistocephalus solidus TaxID=70667 RepID=A0A183SUR6_SCHSO|nr:unnamed protein product [Schistocephalus solidus]